jgi:hypothetical protein
MRLRQSDLPPQDLNGSDHNRASSSVVLDSSRWERGERPTRSHETSLSGAPTHLQKNSTGVALSPDHACTTAPQLLPVYRTRHRSPYPSRPLARTERARHPRRVHLLANGFLVVLRHKIHALDAPRPAPGRSNPHHLVLARRAVPARRNRCGFLPLVQRWKEETVELDLGTSAPVPVQRWRACAGHRSESFHAGREGWWELGRIRDGRRRG